MRTLARATVGGLDCQFCNRRTRAVAARALCILACVVVCCTGCVTRTTSRTPTISEMGRPDLDENGRIVEKKTLWLWER